MDIILAALGTATIEALLHYWPWAKYLKGKPLPRLIAYGLGTVGILLPYTVLMIYRHSLIDHWVVWVMAAVGGITVGICYWQDHTLSAKAKLRDLKQENKIRASQLDWSMSKLEETEDAPEDRS